VWLIIGSVGTAKCSPGVFGLNSESSGGCIPNNTTPFQSVNGSTCNCGPNISCTITVCLACASYSCYIGLPPSTSCTGSNYSNGISCSNCYPDCGTCSNAYQCLSCVANNASPDATQGCLCSAGYYNTTSLTISSACQPCDSGCNSCSSASNCSECIQNAFLVDSSCFCKPGYGTLVNNCTQAFFKVSVTINQTNSLTLIFEEPTSLYLSNLTLSLNNTNLNFSIEKQDEKSYCITPDYLGDIPKKSNLKITLDPLVSKNNSLLFNTVLHIELLETSSFSSEKKNQVKIAAAKSLASQGTTVGLSITVGLSFVNLDFNSLFSFISTAEIFYSTALFNLNLDSVLLEFLIGMRIQSKVPNIFKYIIKEESGSSIPTKYITYGYSTNLFLLNVGIHLTLLALFLLQAGTLCALSMSTTFERKLKTIRQMFRYGIFLRFWVQTFLELLLVSSLGIRYSELNGPVQITDFILCIIVMVRFN
jgi:hypothetical protein